MMETIGRHRVLQGDVMDGSIPLLLGPERVDAVYSDPPWGRGNLAYWRTHNRQAGHPVDWPGFLRRLLEDCAAVCDGPVWIETGVRFEADVLTAANDVGLVHRRTYDCVYGRPHRPNLLLLFGAVDPPDPMPTEQMTGLALVRWALAAMRVGAVVLDPCCGLGTTARACVDLGLTFRGSELNPDRFERSAAILRRASAVRGGRVVR